MLSERFRPTKIASMIGNEQARLEMVRWLKHWKIGSKPLLLTGPPGIGKSSSIHAVAGEFGYTVLEYNASDVRTRDKLREAIGPTLQNTTLFGGEKLMIFLDEIDGISGRSDYAGMDFVLEFIENSTIPVAMAANTEETQKLRKLEQKSMVLRFKPVGEDLVFIYLQTIAARAEIDVSESTLLQIARNCRGDVRQALNSLQTLSGQRIVAGYTDKQFVSERAALDAVLAAESVDEEMRLLRQYDASPYDRVRSIFDSVVGAKNLSIESKSECLELIAQADLLLGKINREQSWRLLRYMDRFLALSTVARNLKRVDSSIPWNLKLSIWSDGRIIKGMLADLCEEYHVGSSALSTYYLPYFALYFKDRPEQLEQFMKKHEFGDSQKRVLLKLAVKK